MTQQNAEKKPSVAAAVIIHDGRVLLVRRRVSEGQLSWQFPAGKVEPGESREQAAVRETREETGLAVSAVKLLGERLHPNTGRLMSYTACEVISGTAHVASTMEIAELAWVAHADIQQYVPYGLFESVQDYLDAALPS
ncbi:NUDIX hydrolase [Streptomyces sp. NRRL F-5126]|uniref:NUDIX hydrolase n=1 Tax=Streptomyces sp. NRRL F-5126 TaxID=1463857 RepID=UPI0004C90F97|nr:NUDIX hydrolase [Streptomyces sp. NRRL F-5126]